MNTPTQAPIAIIGAMQPELDLLQSRLQQAQSQHSGQIVFHTGLLAGKPVVLVLSGIGKVNAAVATALVIQQFKPACVINTGSAGGLGAGLKVGDVVLGAEAAHHDVDVTAFGYVPGQVPQQPPRFASDAALLASGTAALECMLAKCPMVVGYRMKPFTFWLAKRLVKTDYVSLPNLLAGRELVKELLQEECEPQKLAAALLPLLANGKTSHAMHDTFRELHQQIRCNADEQAAQAVLELAQ